MERQTLRGDKMPLTFTLKSYLSWTRANLFLRTKRRARRLKYESALEGAYVSMLMEGDEDIPQVGLE